MIKSFKWKQLKKLIQIMTSHSKATFCKWHISWQSLIYAIKYFQMFNINNYWNIFLSWNFFIQFSTWSNWLILLSSHQIIMFSVVHSNIFSKIVLFSLFTIHNLINKICYSIEASTQLKEFESIKNKTWSYFILSAQRKYEHERQRSRNARKLCSLGTLEQTHAID